MPRSIFGWDLPPGVTQRMIDEAAGGYDERPYDDEPEPPEVVLDDAYFLWAVAGLSLARVEAMSEIERAAWVALADTIPEDEWFETRLRYDPRHR